MSTRPTFVSASIAAGTANESRAAGRALRDAIPFDSHGNWQPAPDRPDPVERVLAGNAGRQERLIPLRMSRMAESPFAFLRGAATVMAWDLAKSPSIGHNVIIDGDAHINNFSLYRTPREEVVFDLNDFDETLVGPWEWDLKRLTASINVAAARERRRSAGRNSPCTRRWPRIARRWRSSRKSVPTISGNCVPTAAPGRIDTPVRLDAEEKATIERTIKRAMKRSHAKMLAKVAEQAGKSWHFKEDPPILTALDAAEKNHVIDGLKAYLQTIAGEWRMMLERYDVAHRVVGAGSVGTRAYLVLMVGRALGDPLFMQVKEGIVPAAAPFVPPLDEPYRHQGRRVVHGQRLMQSSSDALLGWTTISGRDFYVRQMKQIRGSIPVDWLHGATFDYYAWCLGLLLAHAHARTGDAALISGYCGNSDKLDVAYSMWAERYGAQTVADHAAFCAAISHGRVPTAPA